MVQNVYFILKLLNNVEKIFCRFVSEGKATIVLKDPNFTLNLQKVQFFK